MAFVQNSETYPLLNDKDAAPINYGPVSSIRLAKMISISMAPFRAKAGGREQA